MTRLETPVAYLDAPEFQKFWDKDAKMLADAIKRVGKIEEKKWGEGAVEEREKGS